MLANGRHRICVALFAWSAVSLATCLPSRAQGVDEESPDRRAVSEPNLPFSPDSRLVLTVDGNVVIMWDVASGEAMQRFEGHLEPVRAATFSPDGAYVLSGGGAEGDMGTRSRDNSARVWDPETGRELQRFERHEGYVLTVQFSRDGTRVLTAGRDSIARVWDPSTGDEIFDFPEFESLPPPARFSPDGGRILGRVDRMVVIWDAANGQETCRIEIPGDNTSFQDARFSPDGRQVVTASFDGTVRTWHAGTGRQTNVLRGHTSYVHSAVFSSDGQTIMSASHDETVRIWETESSDELKCLRNPGPVHDAMLSSDGTRVLAIWYIDENNTRRAGATLWDVDAGTPIRQFHGHVGAAFSPDSTVVLILGHGPPSLMDARTGQTIRQLN